MPRSTIPAFLASLLAVLVLSVTPSHANSKASKQVVSQIKSAMEAYDLLEYEDAKKALAKTLLFAKRKGLGKKKVAAQVHLYLGIVQFSGFEDKEAAKLEFANAVELDGKIKIPKSYRTKEITKFLDAVRTEMSDNDEVVEPEEDPAELAAAECKKVKGVRHEVIDEAPAGQSTEVQAIVGTKTKAAKVALFYRPDGEDDFKQVTMGREGKCKYTGKIPGSALRGKVLHYYVAALNRKGRPVAGKGSSGSPNIIDVTAAVVGATAADTEDPLGTGGASEDGDVKKSIDISESTGPSFYISLAAGSGGGYVQGETEKEGVDVECCFAPALLHVFPEIGYFVTPRTAVSLALRVGFPVGANVMGHAQAAPAGLVRVRHSFGDAGTGVQVSGGLGAGLIRHTVKISDGSPGMDVDTVASGPLLASFGLGYIKSLSENLRFLAEVNGIAGIPIVKELSCPGNGCIKPDFGLQVDINLGVLVAF